VEAAAGIDGIFVVTNSKSKPIFVTLGNACYSSGVPEQKIQYQLYKTNLHNQYMKMKSKNMISQENENALKEHVKELIDDGTIEDQPPNEVIMWGMYVVIVGSYKKANIARDDLQELIEAHAGEVVTSVTEAVCFLVAPDMSVIEGKEKNGNFFYK